MRSSANVLKQQRNLPLGDVQETENNVCMCGVGCVKLHGDESQSFTVLPRLTPVPVRRQKFLTTTSSDTSALVDVLQRIPGSAEPELLAQVSFTLISVLLVHA